MKLLHFPLTLDTELTNQNTQSSETKAGACKYLFTRKVYVCLVCMWNMMFVFICSVCNRSCGPKWGNVGGGRNGDVEKKGC